MFNQGLSATFILKAIPSMSNPNTSKQSIILFLLLTFLTYFFSLLALGISHILNKKFHLNTYIQDSLIKKIVLVVTIILNVFYMSLDILTKHLHVQKTYLIMSTIVIAVSVIFITVSIIFFIYSHIQEVKTQLKLNQMNERDAYINELEKSNDVLHKFKHDYKNLLLSLSASVNDSDNDNLKSSISKLLNYKRVDLRSDNNTTNLYKIKDKLVKGILVSKLMFAKNNNIKTDFEIDDNVTIPENYSIDITRMLGILLDNAIDASLESDQPELIFAVVSFDDYIEFIIKNSIIPNSNIHTNDVYKTGFTTKENHGGLGLASVREIVDSNDDLFIQNKIKNGYYSTILTVLEDEQCY